MIEEALQEARRLAHENRLEGKDLDELAELEDEEDDDFLEQYRYVGQPRHSAAATDRVEAKSASKSCRPSIRLQFSIRCTTYRSLTIPKMSPRPPRKLTCWCS